MVLPEGLANGRLESMRLTFVTDGVGDPDRILALGRAVIAGGVRAIQVREPRLGAGALAGVCAGLREEFARRGSGVVLVNDRVDVCAAGFADGVHLPRRGLDPRVARRLLPEGAVLGVAAHDEDELAAAAEAGVDYATLSPVFATASKPGQEPLGTEVARSWTTAARLPVIWLGGIDAETLPLCGDGGAAGYACIGALARAAEPERAARVLLEVLASLDPKSAAVRGGVR
jgi:thiamine-phosphate pyrophosphorylase